MAEVREQRKGERAAGREQRRARADAPTEQSDSQVGPQLRRAAATAAAAAFAGALAGGAKALADKRGRRDEPEDEPRDDVPKEEAQTPSQGWGQTPSGSDPSGSDPGSSPTSSAEPEPADEPEEDEQPEHGAQGGEVNKIIERAREYVERVLGSEPESVSGIQRSNGNWCVAVEVVQLRRVPESTDVLASYAVVVDDDGLLISLQQTRRYRRSQADEGR